jgi:integrase
VSALGRSILFFLVAGLMEIGGDYYSGPVNLIMTTAKALPEARTKGQAERAEIDMRQDIYDRRLNHGSGTMRFSDFLDRVYLPYVRENHKSYRDDEQRARAARGFFDERQLGEITTMDVERYKPKLRKRVTKFKRKMSPATVNRYLYTLSHIMTRAVKAGLVVKHPVDLVDKLQEPGPRDRWLSGKEEDQLMPVLEQEGESRTAFAVLPMHTGLRVGEPLSRRRLHANLADAWVYVDKTKNGVRESGGAQRLPLPRQAAYVRDAAKGDRHP